MGVPFLQVGDRGVGVVFLQRPMKTNSIINAIRYMHDGSRESEPTVPLTPRISATIPDHDSHSTCTAY